LLALVLFISRLCSPHAWVRSSSGLPAALSCFEVAGRCSSFAPLLAAHLGVCNNVLPSSDAGLGVVVSAHARAYFYFV
jgi:hypothetical protein